MFRYVTYYLIAGTLYCWVTILQEKLKNIYTEVLFYPVRNYPNWCRLMIVLVSSTLGYHTLSLLATMCFFGEIVWVVRHTEDEYFVWQMALFAFTMTLLLMAMKLVVMCMNEW